MTRFPEWTPHYRRRLLSWLEARLSARNRVTWMLFPRIAAPEKYRAVAKSRSGSKSDMMRSFGDVCFAPDRLQKSFCTGDQKFCGLEARLSCKDVRDLIASR
jgi:hypothetical protein